MVTALFLLVPALAIVALALVAAPRTVRSVERPRLSEGRVSEK